MKPYLVRLSAYEGYFEHQYTVYVPAANLESAAKKARKWARSAELTKPRVRSAELLEGNIAA